jgi:hypothetical protein
MAQFQWHQQNGRGNKNSGTPSRWKTLALFVVVALVVSVLDASFFQLLSSENDDAPLSNYLLQSHQQQLQRQQSVKHDTQHEYLPQTSTISTSSRSQRLPDTYRYANANVCQNHRDIAVAAAPPSSQSKLSAEHIQAFCEGGYMKIARGSGDVILVGPIITSLSKMQHEAGIYGSLAELGVHHGRFTGFLFVTARVTEKLVVADLFEELQHQNVDKSGLGDKRRFLQGLQTYGLSPQDLHTIHVGSSDELPFDWSDQADFEAFRMISVDAGHTAALTFNDLQLAFCNLLAGGIVLLDDFFHSTWPGVTEGLFQFMAMGPEPQVYPFLSCENKLFLTNDKASHDVYYRHLLDTAGSFVTMFAHEKERGKLKFEMNGVNYLRCKRGNMTDDDIHTLWKDLSY